MSIVHDEVVHEMYHGGEGGCEGCDGKTSRVLDAVMKEVPFSDVPATSCTFDHVCAYTCRRRRGERPNSNRERRKNRAETLETA